MTQIIKLGSLFDGIAGFPEAGRRVGIKAIWASEIEPFCIKVSKTHFPDMEHVGSVTDIHGKVLKPVHILTGGSPCQDLSVAGKRAGLAGKRSGLFMDQIRIVKEMHKEYGTDYPRFMLWENVPGAFSSNKGEDFRAVLEETARITDETVIIPKPPKDKWNTAGCIMGNGWSIAWRTLDAQYWGVPQRRRRIFLVADFGGQSAHEVLFKREGLQRHTKESREEGQGITAITEGSSYKAKWDPGGDGDRANAGLTRVVCFEPGAMSRLGGYNWEDKCSTLRTEVGDNRPCIAINHLYESHPNDSRISGPCKICPSISARYGTGGGNTPLVQAFTMLMREGCEGGGKGPLIQLDKSATLNCNNSQTLFEPMYNPNPPLDASYYKGTGERAGIERQVIATYQKITGPLMANSHPGSYTGQDAYNDMLVTSVDCRNLYENVEKSATLLAKENGGQSLNYQNPIRVGYSVRRLTPMECERLQDYMDNWTNIPGASDSARYKACGNSVAVVCPEYVLEGIVRVLETDYLLS